MDINNPLYKNQGIHVNLVLLTVNNGEIDVLLIKRSNNPFFGKWALPGGAVYNNEKVDDAIKRELKEKTDIQNITPQVFGIFSDPNRAPDMRMLGIGYIAVIDKSAINFIRQTKKTDDADWFCLDNIPNDMDYDHNEMLKSALEYLKTQVWQGKILKSLFPGDVTIPELYDVYTKILGTELDRRNFRKKLLTSDILIDTGKSAKYKGKKLSKIYKIKW